ncbi:hypothetical protein EAI_13114 [Harpegnathos saltator]|uniref:Uncharacterized protein n=1 Tax=Harpegnathos saltator TaxID=610380 RepID=E2BSZ4_HARSA|nr:hypothetical protein EAI_13114 [Harpegnathos saltator]
MKLYLNYPSQEQRREHDCHGLFSKGFSLAYRPADNASWCQVLIHTVAANHCDKCESRMVHAYPFCCQLEKLPAANTPAVVMMVVVVVVVVVMVVVVVEPPLSRYLPLFIPGSFYHTPAHVAAIQVPSLLSDDRSTQKPPTCPVAILSAPVIPALGTPLCFKVSTSSRYFLERHLYLFSRRTSRCILSGQCEETDTESPTFCEDIVSQCFQRIDLDDVIASYSTPQQ